MRAMEEIIKDATDAEGEALWEAIRTQYPQALERAALNRRLSEDMAVFIAKNKNTPAEALGFLASDIRFKDLYKLKLALCKNPKCPHRVSLALLKFLKIFDMADLTRNQTIPVALRQKAEFMLAEKLVALPSGVKIALVKRASSEIVMKIMFKADRKVVDAALDSPMLTEGHMYKAINKQTPPPQLIQAIAAHPKWSLRYAIRFGLIRNFNTPMEAVERFIGAMKAADLRALYADPAVPQGTRHFIYNELICRGESTEPAPEEVFEFSGDEDESSDVDFDVRLSQDGGEK